MYQPKMTWKETPPTQIQGVLLGADARQEWLLPWWWDAYSAHNTIPVAFANFGMSKEMKTWCRERGTLLEVPVYDPLAVERHEVEGSYRTHWENVTGVDFWGCRNAWFKKPYACILTPFRKTVWIDLDCEVRGNLAPLFAGDTRALRPEMYRMNPEVYEYNSGVFRFLFGDPLITAWATAAATARGTFRGDQELLSHLIHERGDYVTHFAERVNWSRAKGEEAGILVYHWHGEKGRAHIAHQVWKKSLNLDPDF